MVETASTLLATARVELTAAFLSVMPVRVYSRAECLEVELTPCFIIADKLSYVMSLYYESQNRTASSCDFGGDAQLNSGAVTINAEAAAESCIANPSATFVPGSPSSTSGGGKPTSTSGNGSNGASPSLVDSIQSLGLVMSISAIGAFLTFVA